MITASQVKELREKTGAGMLDCKKALEANNGDINASIDWLREKGISKAAKKLLGIITSTDIIRFLNAKELFDNLNSNLATDVLKTVISEIMVKEPVTIEPNMTIGDLCELFAEKNIGGVPVVKNDKVMGIITERDILRAVKRY